MSKLTIFLARSIGLFMVLLVAGFLVRGGTAIEATIEDEGVMISYAIISLAMGVAMVIGHNVWSGGALPVVVTLVGWLVLAKGFLLLVLAPDEMSAMATIGTDERIDPKIGTRLMVAAIPARSRRYFTWKIQRPT